MHGASALLAKDAQCQLPRRIHSVLWRGALNHLGQEVQRQLPSATMSVLTCLKIDRGINGDGVIMRCASAFFSNVTPASASRH